MYQILKTHVIIFRDKNTKIARLVCLMTIELYNTFHHDLCLLMLTQVGNSNLINRKHLLVEIDA